MIMKQLLKRLACSICQALTEPEPIEQPYLPTKDLPITGTDLYKILRERLGKDGDIYISDAHSYFLCRYDDIAYFLAQDETNKFEYQGQAFDCDDFAARLYGQFSVPGWSDLCFGKIWTMTHAFNLLVSEDRQVLFIEPQTDEIIEGMPGTSKVNRWTEM